MKKSMLALFAPIALIGSIFISTSAMAQNNRTSYINNREDNQQARIAQGVSSGALTAGETARLEREESAIQREKVAAKRDGYMNRYEREKLNRELNHVSNQIYQLKHNGRTQF